MEAPSSAQPLVAVLALAVTLTAITIGAPLLPVSTPVIPVSLPPLFMRELLRVAGRNPVVADGDGHHGSRYALDRREPPWSPVRPGDEPAAITKDVMPVLVDEVVVLDL